MAAAMRAKLFANWEVPLGPFFDEWKKLVIVSVDRSDESVLAWLQRAGYNEQEAADMLVPFRTVGTPRSHFAPPL